jgi:hypothetical protein
VGVLAVLLEIWMLIRQAVARIIPKCLAGMDVMTALIKYTTKFWLLLLTCLVIALFGLYNSKHRNNRMTKGWFLALMISGSVCLLYTFVLMLESFIVRAGALKPKRRRRSEYNS